MDTEHRESRSVAEKPWTEAERGSAQELCAVYLFWRMENRIVWYLVGVCEMGTLVVCCVTYFRAGW